MKKKILPLFILCCLLHTATAQPKQGQARIDSLLLVVPSMKEDTSKAHLLCTIAFEFYRINPDEGLKYGQQSLNLSEKLNWEKGIADAYRNMGVLYGHGKGDNKKALEYYFKSLTISGKQKDSRGMSLTYNDLGLAYEQESDYPKALDYFFKALKIAEATDEKIEIAKFHSNIGMIYMDQGDYPKALDYYFKALAVQEKLNDKQNIAEGLSGIGIIYYFQRNYTKALEYYFKALKIEEEVDYLIGMASEYMNIGNVYAYQSLDASSIKEKAKLLSLSQDYTFKALKIKTELGEKRGIASNLGNIGDTYLEMAKLFDEPNTIKLNPTDAPYFPVTKSVALNYAQEYLNKSIVIGKEVGNLRMLSDVYNDLVVLMEMKGNYKEALSNYKHSIELRDSIYSQENKDKIAALGKQREEDVKQKEIEIQKLEIEAAKKQSRYYIIGIALLILLVLFVIRTMVVQKKANKLKQELAIIADRARISSEMHDDLGSGLSKISMLSDMLTKDTAGADIKTHLSTISRSSKEVVEAMGDIIWSMNVKHDKLTNLIVYTRKYAMEFFENTAIDCKVIIPSDVPELSIEGKVRRNIFLVVKEALHNVLKHACADKVTLQFEITTHAMRIVIEDNGKGIKHSEEAVFRNGLTNMASRMEEVSGTFLITAPPNSEALTGTRIELTLPI
jgi:signal transduction histidine kinase/Tfp pilus assembly protein PilF